MSSKTYKQLFLIFTGVLYFGASSIPLATEFTRLVMPPDTLFAELVLSGESLFDGPSYACTNTPGNIYILDAAGGYIVVCDSSGSLVEKVAGGWQGGGLSAPLDMDVGQRSWVYIADSGNQRIVVMDDALSAVAEIHVGFRIRTVDALPDGRICAPSGPNAVNHLITIYTPQGEKCGEFGDRIVYDMGNYHLNCVNLYYAAHNLSNGELAVARVAMPLVTIYSSSGDPIRRFLVRHARIDSVRSRFFSSMSTYFERNGHCRNQKPSLMDYMDDIAATAVDGGKPKYINYIAGIEYFGGSLYLLVSGDLLELSVDGTVLSHYVLRHPNGDKIWSHRMWLSGDGKLVTVDRFHEKSVHLFQMPQ